MIVVDASLAIEIALATPDGQHFQNRLRTGGEPLGAPELIDLEVLQVLRRQLRRNTINVEQADSAAGLFYDLPIERFTHAPLRSRIWSLRDNLTAYDAAYFALAELLGAALWTRDQKFAGIPGHDIDIKIL